MRQESSQQISHIIALIVKYHHGTLTAADQGELDDWLNADVRNRTLFNQLMEERYQHTNLDALDKYDEEKAFRSLMNRIGMPGRRGSARWKRWAVAAAVAGLGVFLLTGDLNPWRKGQPVAGVTRVAGYAGDVPPGGNKAILTLAGGRQIVLDTMESRTLALQGNTAVMKLNGRRLTLLAGDAHLMGGAPAYNTLATPRGGQFELELPDGTDVWLNALSSIRFPTRFTGASREVEVDGEVYFEVAQHAGRPFIVRKGDTRVQVLGTHFDVTAYDDESTLTVTLLEGSVKVSTKSAGRSAVLRPGQQARLDNNGQMKVLEDVDVNRVVAWKDGRFEFSGNIQEIMRRIARWYNVSIVYQGGVTDKAFEGSISRYEYVSQVLKMLELTGSIHFTVRQPEATGETATIIVKP